MRITQNFTNRMYLKYNNRLLGDLNRSMKKIESRKAFFRASEDSINANRTLAVRRGLRNLDMYDDNLTTAKNIYQSAETGYYTLAHDVYIEASVKLEAACNDSYSADDRAIYANELRQFAESAVETLNAAFTERQIYAGTNNSKAPFEAVKNADGSTTVKYNGVPVDEITEVQNGSEFMYLDSNGKEVPGTKPIYVDIGIGIEYDAEYNVKPQTAADISINGAAATGCGERETNENGDSFSLNFIQLLYDTADALQKNDVAYANAAIDKLCTARGKVLNAITNLGMEQNSMDFYIDRNADYRITLQERQNEVEGIDMEEEIVNMSTTEAVYNAVLQMSSKVIPTSIFDFI